MTKSNDIPLYDFIEDEDLTTISGIGTCLENLIYFIQDGYFYTWEAVVQREEGLPLTDEQEEALADLLDFSGADEDMPIYYIDEIPRPNEPWYETVRKIVPKLLLNEPFKTFEIYDEIYHFGWPELVDCLEDYGSGLSLPEGVSSPIEVVPPEIRHRLWLQYCIDELSGLGQEEELTLENEEQKSWRIENFINSLKSCKESVDFLNLSLDDIFKIAILPPRDEKILRDSMIDRLKIKSSSDPLGNVL